MKEFFVWSESSSVIGLTVTGCWNRQRRLRQHLAKESLDAALISDLRHVERSVRPGVNCRTLYEDVAEMLDGYEGWSFQHHLGHGIGLCPHEAPRLNPHWDDTFQVGDVFTAEPGLYGPDLRAGLRIEEDYLITESGTEKLSSFSTNL